MISAWHLMWIIPVSMTVGVLCMALLIGAKEPEIIYDDYYDHDISGLLEED